MAQQGQANVNPPQQAAGSLQIDAVTFALIPAGRWENADDPQCVRVRALRDQLEAIRVLWSRIIDAADAGAVTEAYNALKAGPKIVNLAGLDTQNNVFLGGSRKRRQSKKKKNSKHNNKNNQ
jgi:hypothetical protein